jgi:transglutaminase-like putative cysteine protease
LKRSGLTIQLQLSYLLLFGVSMVASLWMKGHPVLTLALLGALLPFGLLARIPHKYFNQLARQILQVIIAAGALYWGKTRVADASMDLALVETTSLLGMALVIGGVRKEYEMLVTLSVILLGFGGLSPGRPMYFRAFFGFIGIAILLLYQTRTLRIFGLDRDPPDPVPFLRQNWGYRLTHLGMTVGLTLFLLSTVPMPHGRIHTRGFFPVSFDTKQQMEFPELWGNWVKPAKTIWTDNPGTTQTIDSDVSPTVLARNSPRLVRAEGGESFDSRDGLGGFGVGKDLVFRVRAPAKLYWLGQVYDRYDGKTWTASPMLREGKSGLDRFRPRNEQEIVQVFRVEKNVTRHLVGAYRPTKYEYLNPNASKDVPLPGSQINIDRFLGGTTFKDDRVPEPPWTYRVTSMTPALGSDNPMAPWESNLRRGWNYRYVPRELVTPRMRRLVADLTSGVEGDMAKATAIRNFLRENYTYNIEAPAIPKDREVVDYFLFETREGYCQHFAQSMTVLARLAGLPSRVATGFLPGDYNVLANCFEVYEYHAHAWCQVFIEPWGWLTFDGVPPGELPMRKTTSLLGNLMDPFGEDWDAYPPEFSKPVEDTRKQVNQEETAKKSEEQKDKPKNSGFFSDAAAQVYAKAVEESGGAEPTPQELAKAAFLKSFEWVAQLFRAIKDGLVDWSARAWDRIKTMGMAVFTFVKGLPVFVDVILALVLIALRMLWKRRRRIRRWIDTWLFRRRMLRMWQSVEHSRHASPAIVIGLCHDLAWQLLRLVGQRRPGNLDAIEFSQWLSEKDPELGREMSVLAPSVARRLFSNRMPNREEADDVYSATSRLRQLVFDRLSDPTRRVQPIQ